MRTAIHVALSLTIAITFEPTCRSLSAADKVELSRIFPSGGQLGSTVEVEATGKFPVWPIELWSDSPALQWSCLNESGKLQVKIDSSATLGLHWMRIYHPGGATAVRPFLVGLFPERNESEPNDRVTEATQGEKLPLTFQGILNKRGDVDLYSISLKANESVFATVDATKWLASPADVSLQIVDSKGFVLEENIDHAGLDPYLEYRARVDGTYIIRVFGFPANPDSTIGFSGGNDWVYRLRLDSKRSAFESALDFELQPMLEDKHIEVEIGKHVALEQSLAINLPAKVKGVISESEQTDYLQFSAKQGEWYRVTLYARLFGSSLDATVSILDSQGKQLVQQDDVGNDRDPVVDWKSPADGIYNIAISDFHLQGGPDHRYIASIEERAGDFNVSISQDLIEAIVGKELEIFIGVARENDFKGDIHIVAEGLPDSIKCVTVDSKHGTDSAKKVSLKITGSETFQGAVRLVATSTDSSGISKVVSPPKSKPIWLSIVKD